MPLHIKTPEVLSYMNISCILVQRRFLLSVTAIVNQIQVFCSLVFIFSIL
jgi:hypothetical protein